MPAIGTRIGGALRHATIALALAGAGFALALAFLRGFLPIGRTWTDGAALLRESSARGARRVLWEAPAFVPTGAPAGLALFEPAIAPDGETVAFAAGEPGRNLDLFAGRLAAGRIEGVRPLHAFNSPYDDRAPAFHEVGDEKWVLYFASDRPEGEGGLDLYVAPWEGGAPQPLAELNTADDETDPSTSPATGALAFASDRLGSFDLFVSESEGFSSFREPAVLHETSSAAADRSPAFRPDGGAIVFASDRDGASFDLFVTAFDPNAGWCAARPLEPFVSADDETDPAPSPEGFAMLLARRVEGGTSALERSRSREILLAAEGGPSLFELLALAALLLLVALLAWLGKRWNALDLLAKCLLLSILVHLLFLLLSKRVDLTQEIEEEEGKGRTFRVKVLPREELARGARAHGEKVEVARAAFSAPERAQPQPPSLDAAPSPPAAAAPSLEAPLELAHASEPERAAPPAPSADRSPAPSSPPLRDDEPDAAAKRSGGKLDLSLASAEVAEGTRAQPSPNRATPSRESSGEPAAPGAIPVEIELRAPGPTVTRRAASGEMEARRIAVSTPQVASPKGPGTAEPTRGEATPFSLAPVPFAERGTEGPPPKEPGTLPSPVVRSERAQPSPLALEPGSPPAQLDRTQAPARPLPERHRLVARGPDLAAPSSPPTSRASSNAPVSPAATKLEAPAFSAPSPISSAAPPRRARPSPPALAPAPPRPTDVALDLAPPVVADEPPSPAAQEGTPYEKRFGSAKDVALREHGGTPETERAVASGLRYLASIQRRAGHWGDRSDRDAKYRDLRIGKTGLALLAFLGAGHTPGSGTEHSENVARALRFLEQSQDLPTGHFGNSEAYAHGIASYAIAETYAMTKDPELRGPLERGVRRILDMQQIRNRDPRVHGGWSYYYPDGSIFDTWPRASVTAWQVMALESAKLSGFEIPDEAFEAARGYLLRSFDEEEGYFRYSHDPSRLESAYRTLPGSTPASIFALTLLGEGEDPRVLASLDFVRRRPPRSFRVPSQDRFVSHGEGNIYYWYYATLALFQRGGEDWARWNVAMQRALLPAQAEDGSWPPIDPYAEIAGDDEGDRSYTTAVCVLMLEVYYRYVTPLLRWHPTMPEAKATPAAAQPRRPM
jgi:hypothetical protein